MKILVIGRSGQLSYELLRLLGSDTQCLGRDDTDITNEEVLFAALNQYSPDVIINAAAYTAVDKAEQDVANCQAINTMAVQHLATYCKQTGAFLVHISTDYVFNGHKGIPYLPDDPIEPQGIYGKTKAEGEQALLSLLPETSCLIRTAWVYSAHGNNFVKTMLRLMKEKDSLSVIDDQIGSPTWAKGLAEACIDAAKNKIVGIYHWTDEGVASWYDFAVAIQELALDKSLLDREIHIAPIPSSDYPTPAKRPHYSVLDKTSARKAFTSCKPAHWRKQLSAMMDELK